MTSKRRGGVIICARARFELRCDGKNSDPLPKPRRRKNSRRPCARCNIASLRDDLRPYEFGVEGDRLQQRANMAARGAERGLDATAETKVIRERAVAHGVFDPVFAEAERNLRRRRELMREIDAVMEREAE